jgi:ABC-type branched-subunit amino acid transport system substrate-binding protein
VGLSLTRARPVVAGLVAVALLAGCGATSKSSQPTTLPTVSLWLSATTTQYRQVSAGAKLALAEHGGRAGPFRVNFAARPLGDAEPNTTADALGNAREAVQDPQASAVITDAADAPAKNAITLLNEAGIPAVSLGDRALQRAACSDRSAFYPNGHATAIVVPPGGGVPAAWGARFRAALRYAPTEAAYRGYEAAGAVITALGQKGVATSDAPPRLNRDALANALVRGAGRCA